MSQLKIRKANTLPVTLEASCVYLIKSDSDGLVRLFITDATATVTYRTIDTQDITALTMAIISSLTNQPNGIAGLDANGNLTANIGLSTLDTTPAAPGTIKVVRTSLGGKDILSYVDDNGLVTQVQAMLGTRKIGHYSHSGNSNNSTYFNAMLPFTISGTMTARNVATGSLYNMSKRAGIVSSNGNGSLCGYRIPALQHKIGGGDDTGGFFMVHRFAINDIILTPQARMFIGMRNSVTSPTNVSPATINNCIGVGNDANDTTLKLFHGGSVPQTPIDLGVNFPVASSELYELVLNSPRFESAVYYQVTRLRTNQTISGVLTPVTDGVELPSNSTLLTSMAAFRCNNTTSNIVGIDLLSHYVESDI